jgi:hypothetical protein
METTIIVSSQSTIAKSTIASEPVSKLVEFLGEWDSKSFITWYDSQTRKTHQFDAFANSFAPLFTFEAVRKLSSSRKRRAFLAKFRALKELGVL